MNNGFPSSGQLAPEWVDFLIMIGAIALVAVGALIWTFFIRKPGRRRRRKSHHRHEHRSPNPSLAQIGGLPPVRQKEKPPARQMPTAQP